MRAVGMTRRQVRSLVRWEAVIIALFGAFLGIVIGVVVRVGDGRGAEGPGHRRSSAPRRSSSIIVIFVLAAFFGVLAAIWPARKASKLDVLQAISTE